MSGSGRKHRAKHLTQQFLDTSSWERLEGSEKLAICMASPQGNHVRVLEINVIINEEKKEEFTEHIERKSSEHTQQERQEPRSSAEYKEQLIILPGKFRKVIWLSIKDVVVVADGTLRFKLSDEHIAKFLKCPGNEKWTDWICEGKRIVEERRCAMERLPLHIKSVTTTTSVLPITRHEQLKTEEQSVTEIDGELTEFVNPNWKNIHHQEHYFQTEESEEDNYECVEHEDDHDVEEKEKTKVEQFLNNGEGIQKLKKNKLE